MRSALLGTCAGLLLLAACKFDELPPIQDDASDDARTDGPEADAAGDANPDVDAREPGARCDTVPATCGPASNESCCATATTIPAGTFLRSYDLAADAFNDMNYPASLSSFVLDKYEITVGRYRVFLESGYGTQARPPADASGAHPTVSGSGWHAAWNSNLPTDTAALRAALKCRLEYQTWTDSPGANENKALTCLSWYDAMAFCIWDGGYLPTEAEWNYAAVGGDAHRTYPWSSPSDSTAIDCTQANFNPGTPCVGLVSRVGSQSPTGDARWGHSDLAGNVWEWTLDAFVDPLPLPCSNCASVSPTATHRVHRGGSFFYDGVASRGARREAALPAVRTGDRGARCARTP